MDLQKRFLPYCDHEYANREDNAFNCVEVAEEYAVEFSKWLIRKCDFQKHGVWLYKGMEMTNEELLEIFKHDVE